MTKIQLDNTSVPESGPTLKPPRKLTRKQQAFIAELVNNPKQSATSAAAAVYNVKARHTAEVIASENLSKPEIMAELAKYSNTAEVTLVKVMNHSTEQMYKTEKSRSVDWGNLSRQTATDILNRVHGMPTSKTEVTSTAVTLNIDLTATANDSDRLDI